MKPGNCSRGFTLIELLVVISIIALLSSVVLAALSTARMKARDAQRIANAQELIKALEIYAVDSGTYILSGSGLTANDGNGFVAKNSSDDSAYSTTSIATALKVKGLYSSDKLNDPVYGKNNYYLAVCAASSTYGVYLNVEQSSLAIASSSLATQCGGSAALALGMDYLVSSGGVGVTAGQSGGSSASAGVTAVASTGSIDATFNSNPGANGAVNAIAIQSDGKVIVGGAFTIYNGTLASHIIRLNADGSVDNGFLVSMGTAFDGAVNAIAVQADGSIVVGGAFTQFNGATRNNIARLNSSGGLDGTFYAGTGFSGAVNAIAINPTTGDIAVGGAFALFDGASYSRIAVLAANGHLNGTFVPTTGANGVVESVAFQSDGKVIIGGNFNQYNGVSRAYIARILTTGANDTTFVTGAGFNTYVRSVQVLASGKILATGDFTTYQGASRGYISEINSDGSVDGNFTLSGLNGAVNSASVQADGNVIVGGIFVSSGAATRHYITRVLPSGADDSTFVSEPGAGNQVLVTTLQPDGKIIAGGNFTTYKGSTAGYVVRIK